MPATQVQYFPVSLPNEKHVTSRVLSFSLASSGLYFQSIVNFTSPPGRWAVLLRSRKRGQNYYGQRLIGQPVWFDDVSDTSNQFFWPTESSDFDMDFGLSYLIITICHVQTNFSKIILPLKLLYIIEMLFYLLKGVGYKR